MPVRELMPYVEMLPRIEARRAIATAEQIAVGMGRMKPEDHRAAMGRWRAALGTAAVARPEPAQLAGMAKAAGIGFRRVPRRPS